MCAVSSVFSHRDHEKVAEWIVQAGHRLEVAAFGDELRKDDDPVVVAVDARWMELAAQVLVLFDDNGSLELASKYQNDARKVREAGTIAIA